MKTKREILLIITLVIAIIPALATSHIQNESNVQIEQEYNKQELIFHGLDLSTVPHETNSAKLPDLFEERSPGSKSYNLKNDLLVIYFSLDGIVYIIPDKNIFYVQHDKLGSSTLTYYGPIEGDPIEILNLKSVVQESRTTQIEPLLQIRMIVVEPEEYPNAELLEYDSALTKPEKKYVQKKILFDEADIIKAELQQLGDNSRILVLHLTDIAAERMEAISSNNIGRQFAVVLDGSIIAISTISDTLSSETIMLDVSSWDMPMINSAVTQINEATKMEPVQEPIIDITGWTQADLALKNAMNRDPSFYWTQKHAPQKLAIKAWEELLKRNDLTDSMRIFATWRIASLCGGNLDSSLGEKPDSEKSKKLYKQVMDMGSGLICHETINSTTQYATQPGSSTERAERLVESYRYLKSVTPETIAQSAERINKNGRVLDKKFFSNIARLPDAAIEQKIKLLNFMVNQGLDSLNGSISGFLKYCRDEKAGVYLLNTLNNVAEPADLEQWRDVKSQFFDSSWGDLQSNVRTDVQI